MKACPEVLVEVSVLARLGDCEVLFIGHSAAACPKRPHLKHCMESKAVRPLFKAVPFWGGGFPLPFPFFPFEPLVTGLWEVVVEDEVDPGMSDGFDSATTG